MHPSAVQALAVLMEREEPVAITIQNVAEFWNAATRPALGNLEFPDRFPNMVMFHEKDGSGPS
jgi:hypothetical protein